MIEADIREALTEGRFGDALSAFRRHGAIKSKNPTHRALLAELLEHTGSSVAAKELAQTILDCETSEETGARAHIVLGNISYEAGQPAVAIHHLQKAIHLAGRADSIELLCWAQLKLMRLFLQFPQEQALTSLLAEVRRNVARAGVPALNASLHISFGRLDVMRGSIDRARCHFEAAQTILRFNRNWWLQASLELDLCSVYTLWSELKLATDHARAALECAERASHHRSRVAAVANLAQLSVAGGDFSQAERYLQKGLEASQHFAGIRVSLLDSSAQMCLALNRLDEAAELLDQCNTSNPGQGQVQVSWYELASHQTRIRLLQRQNRLEEAVLLATDAMQLAEARSDRHLAALFRVLKADCLITLGRIEPAAGLLSSAWAAASGSPLEMFGEIERVRGKAFAHLGDAARAEAHFARARRIFDAVGNACLKLNVDRDQAAALPGSPASAAPTPLDAHPDAVRMTIQTVAELLELGARPDLLGGEAAVLLGASGAALTSALTCTRDDRKAAAAPETPAAQAGTAPVLTLALGRSPRGHVRLDVEPGPSVDARETVVSLQKIAVAAAALEQMRQEERRRTSLWPDDLLDDDLDGVFVSASTIEVLQTARRVAGTDLPILLVGETGTGKEVLAQAIHRSSPRSQKPFLPFNCNSVPKEMLDSQLFGHRRGAFTGAATDFSGVIRAAEGGTLFLDEIGEIGLDLQPKLLRFLETREVHPLGDARPIAVDVRIIAATNADLDRLMAAGSFREDLFYRLNVVKFVLPPLRDRREEIPSLLRYFLDRSSRELKKPVPDLSDETFEYLLLYKWPGNVRQLANEVRRMMALAEPGRSIRPQHLSPEIQASRRTVRADAEPESLPSLQLRLDQPLQEAIDQLERAMIGHALALSEGHLETAAQRLGLSRKGLYLKRQRLGLPH